MTANSLPLPELDDLPQVVADRLRELPAINVYRMIANAPQCLIPWTDMVKALYDSKVAVRYREIAILRQAYRANSPYELHQHRFIALANGVSPEEIEMICSDGPVTELSSLENAICRMSDELEKEAMLSDDTLSVLQSEFDVTQLTELIILTSFYCCVARVLNATRVAIEDDNPLEDLQSPS